MSLPLTAYISLISVSGVLNLFLCVYVFVKRHHYNRRIAKYFILYTGAIVIYCFAAAFALSATNVEQAKLWTIIQYIGMPASTALGLVFIMHYLGIKLTWKSQFALFVIPVMSFLMVATNDWHHLHYRIFEIDPALGAPFIHVEIGIWYIVHGIYTCVCLFGAVLLILLRWKETEVTYRPQLMALLYGQLIPLGAGFVYLLGLRPQGVDPVPMALCLSSLLYLWAISSARLFALMPVAKDAIFNSINDGVIVLDESHRLIEFNRASKQMFPALDKSFFGRDFETVWKELSGKAFPFEWKTEIAQELQLKTDQSERVYQVRISSLQHANTAKGLLLILNDITEEKNLKMKLEELVYYDDLTGIYNRRAFFAQSNRQLASAKEQGVHFTIVLIDIDHFKRVNDTYGHHVGDRLLRHIVKVCEEQLEEGMLFARYGGEEFVLVLEGLDAAAGQELAERLRRQIEQTSLETATGVISVTLSSGVAELSQEDGESIDQLLNKADLALYAAKRQGRNRVEVYRNPSV
ncbi:histidine kinase N-terminal 7TM domain-containing protein [Planomicrobium sp. YIM 101495]|uniref:histidine kinase N-terminal 7TM domain-containing diguanylate cyclase n=1 Tax=Planomicrobium sp. YIM 101495 TaxID=2665160 RepID=UPI0012B6EE9A|nr:histidine kinase N-terminal 7TM domain-containing protein [Planomicrobium sp. YIM 101495]MTD31161.1 diguanylate cyclase [Planomicrobium sp. YIM 101495]